MNILGIDTSGRAGTVALRTSGRHAGECSLAQAGRRHAQTLVAEIDRLVRQAGLRLPDLDAVAVSIGPGSFTGLRVGVTCAKTLSWATGCRLAAVDTLQAIAESVPADVQQVDVVSDAQRGEFFLGRYVRAEGRDFVRVGPIGIVDAQSWCRRRGAGDVVTGPGLDKYAADIPGSVRIVPFSPDSDEQRRTVPHATAGGTPAAQPQTLASIVARLGERQVAAGDTADLWSLEPFYLRKSAAEETRMEDGG